jgi:hypothetical protein
MLLKLNKASGDVNGVHRVSGTASAAGQKATKPGATDENLAKKIAGISRFSAAIPQPNHL